MGSTEDALTRSQASDILRYWLASLRLEEALALRPRAQRASRDASLPRLDAPQPGQVYFKVPLDRAAARLLADGAYRAAALDGERTAFFEDWLHAQYRRAGEEGSLSHLFCFPVVHLPRGELAGLLRMGVQVQFASGDAPFAVPSPTDRRLGTYPAPPDAVEVAAAERDADTWPFFVDTRLLAHPLGVSPDVIDAFFDALRACESVSELDMLTLVAEMLESAVGGRERTEEARPADDPEGEPLTVGPTVTRIGRAMQALLERGGGRAKVYPVGIVVDATRARTTWHLQRELTLLSEGPSVPYGSGLERYLTGRPGPAVVLDPIPQRALFDAPALTPRQREAADHAWASSFAAVQGPPGTGKTTVILHLAAEALVRQVEALVDGRRMGSELFVVTSSNNRAVDNVLGPLARDGLPLALRVGSRQVSAGPLAATLRRALTWLKQAQAEPEAVHRAELEAATARFVEVRGPIDALWAPQRAARERGAERARLERSLAQLLGEIEDAGRDAGRDVTLTRAATTKQTKALTVLTQRTTELSRMCEPTPNVVRLSALTRFYAKTVEPVLNKLERALGPEGLPFEWPLPPASTTFDVTAQTEAWEEAAELALTRLGELRERVAEDAAAARRARKIRKLRRRLADLPEPVPDDAPTPSADWSEHEPLCRALFEAAVRVREAWARVHAAELVEALEEALRCASELRSLRSLFRRDPDAAAIVCQLFGVWGSTLLSLGNVLPPDASRVARVVIDEAGQCHPAHAVSALMRSRNALIVGDVHQLTPVIELGVEDDTRVIRACALEVPTAKLAPYRTHAESTTSAQALAERAVLERQVLVDHFRCHPAIIAVSDELCGYGLDVHTGREEDHGLLPHAVGMIDVRGAQEPLFGSWWNERELRETLRLLDHLLAAGAGPADLAVITPYRGQLDRLRRAMVERGIPLEASPELLDSDEAPRPNADGLALGTVHRFQGGERSVVLFTSVVTRTRSLAFLNDRPNLLNVAVSRAREHFVCIGDRSTLARGERTRLLVEAAAPLLRSPD